MKRKKKAAEPAAKRRGRPRKRRRNGELVNGELVNGKLVNDEDLISQLPDDILRTIICLLPTKDGARTPALARRWRPLWRSSPLNIEADYFLSSNEFKRLSVVSRILSEHPGPARCFTFRFIRLHKAKKRFAEEAAQIENWFNSRALDGLQELDICFQLLEAYPLLELYPLPPSVFRLAPTLLVAKFGDCEFPMEIPHSLTFPLLKQLTLWRVSISQDVFHGVLSGCNFLESLSLERLSDVNCLCISSASLRSVRLCACFSYKGNLFIDDAPLLERLLLPCPGDSADTIRVIKAPKLEILGLLSPRITEFEIANIVFQTLTPRSLNNTIATVKVLALQFSVPDLNAVIDVLRCFPCLEKLHVNWEEYLKIPMKDARQYDPLDPVKCLETHLRELVLKNYHGGNQDVGFAKFFVLNAKVLKGIQIGVEEMASHRITEEWVTNQYRLLEMGNRASEDAQLEFVRRFNQNSLDAHNLSIADPFN